MKKVVKERITLNLDPAIIAYFKHVGETEERPYQGLINKVLKDYIASLPPEQTMVNQGD